MRHQNSVFHDVLKHVPWDEFDGLVAAHKADKHVRRLSTKSQFIALLYGQLSGAVSLREIVGGLESHAARLYHVGAKPASRSTLADANALRPSAVFGDLFAAMVGRARRGLRRAVGEATYLIDSTSVRLSGLGEWARFSATACGAKAHVIYDADADRPIYAAVTPANVNDITAAQAMPIEAGATYVFDLGYYDYGWWAKMDKAGCRKNPFSDPVREVRVRIDTGKVLRILCNDLDASAQEIANLYKRRWAIELFFRWVKQTLKIRHFLGTSENAVRIQIAVALIAFLLLRLAQAAQKTIQSPLAFARLVRANLMHRRTIDRLIRDEPNPRIDPRQMVLEWL